MSDLCSERESGDIFADDVRPMLGVAPAPSLDVPPVLEEATVSVQPREHVEEHAQHTVTPQKKRRASFSPSAPRKNPPRRQVKQRDRRIDWFAAKKQGMKSYTYVLTNDDDQVYTGSARDWQGRLQEHNSGGTRSTRRRTLEWRVAAVYGPFCNRTAASRFESFLKRSGGRGPDRKLAAADRELAAHSQMSLKIRLPEVT